MPRYSWIKLEEHFFNDDNILALESQKNGERFVVLYLKLLLKSLKNKDGDHYGVLRFNEAIPYTPDLLSTVFHMDVDTVRVGIDLFVKLGMLRILEDGTMYVEAVNAMIGTETDSAERMRRLRERLKEQKMIESPSQSDKSDVTSDDIYIKSNIKSNIESKEKERTSPNGDRSPSIKTREEIDKERESRARVFYGELLAYAATYPKEMLRAFYDYWTEPQPSGRKFRKELQKTWDTGRRLATWAAHDKNRPSFGRQEEDPYSPEHIAFVERGGM